MKKLCNTAAILAVTAFAGAAFAADIIELPAEMGKISFPHQKHQKALKNDCKKCHTTGLGKIAEKSKDWAHNVNCKKCHTEMKAAGKKTGPTGCKECHKK